MAISKIILRACAALSLAAALSGCANQPGGGLASSALQGAINAICA